MSKRAQRGKTKFLKHWKNIYSWVTSTNDPYSAKCNLCASVINVSSMGIQALKSHAEGKKHKSILVSKNKLVQELSFENSTLPAVLESQPNSTVANQTDPKNVIVREPEVWRHTELKVTTNKKKTTLDSYILKDQVTINEALWCIQVVMTHRSLRSAESDIQLMKIMSQDKVIHDMKLSKTKISYVINNGLGPYFSAQLMKTVQDCENLVVAFDESLNKFAQSQQMDVIVRFWDDEINEVKSRYLTSVFLTQSKAVDLVDALKTALQYLDLKKIIQISMDGPNVNWKVFTLLQDEIKSDLDNSKMLLNIGSCGIHVVHCAFKTGIKGTQWELTKLLRAIFYLFKDSPSRRGAFTTATGCKLFPLKFCETRWIENITVVQRVEKLLIALKKYVEKVEENPKMRPKCKSYITVKDAMKDNLLPAKLAFFNTLAGDVEPFMREFQTDAPVTPLLYHSLHAMTEALMARIVKKEVLNNTQLKKIDVNDKQNLRPIKDFDIGFSTRKELGNCKNVSTKDAIKFYADCGNAVQLTVQKIMERSPLKYDLTKFVSCLNPEITSFSDTDKLMRRTLDEFVKVNIVGAASAEIIAREFSVLLKSAEFKEAARNFRRDEMRLDNFWVNVTEAKKYSSELKMFIKLVLILSHGNASVERGFSINKDCIAVNQKNQSLIAQRQIFDYVSYMGGISKVSFSKPLVHAVRNAHKKYREVLEDQQKEKEAELKSLEKQKEEEKVLRVLEQRKKEMDKNREELIEEIEKKKKIVGRKR